ncbi:MAG: diphthamide synthesis protein [Nanoarchaeota archaeon]|nr:diphthamide synthesis protein [Nanoarchaeota archaeon]
MNDYNLELEKAVSEIKKQKAKKVCIQLPDGLKPKAGEITDTLKEKTGAEIFIWLGSCFGACDIPEMGNIKADLLIQWGHSRWSS